MDGKTEYLTISQLSTLLNISGPTLRFWESEFAGVFEPLRTAGGQRRYTTAHVVVLEKIISMKKQGLKLAEIRDALLRGKDGTPTDNPGSSIDILTDRITRAIKREIHQFFQENNQSGNPETADRSGCKK